MNPKNFDVIVIGVGGVGSAALYELSKRGLRVLGIDRFEPGHHRGSSHGETRVIRKAYFEHPSYVPLLIRAYENWHTLESVSGRRLLRETGILEIGPSNGILLAGIRTAAKQFQLELEEINPTEFSSRFPGFVLPAGSEAIYEPEGGFLRVEECVRTYVRLAMQLGGQLVTGKSVESWTSASDKIEVCCGAETFKSDALVITAGAWATELLGPLGVDFRVLRKHLHWYPMPSGTYGHPQSPVFFYETPHGCYYGFPSLDQRTIKVAEHSGGEPIDDPLGCDRSVDTQERQRVERFLSAHLSDVRLAPTHHEVCMYTMTPDEHFVVDRHPEFPNVCVAAGLSGHGYKFASVLGELLADMVEGKPPSVSLDFLSAARPGLRAAGFQP